MEESNVANLNDKSTIPVSWLALILVAFSGFIITCTFWVARVDFRLSRIETAMGLKNEVVKIDVISSAIASEE